MDLDHLATPAAVFVAGLVASAHCPAMCGPLTCVVLPRRKPALTTAIYHASRVTAYILMGGILGAAGNSAAAIFNGSAARIFPWVLVALLAGLGLGLEKWIPVPPYFSRLLLNLRFGGDRGTSNAALLGLATPFLPCAPLYLVFSGALVAGSLLAGMKFMALFAVGTVPLYWLAQTQFFRLQNRLSPPAIQRLRRGLAWASAILLVWRVTGSGAGLAAAHCPFCL